MRERGANVVFVALLLAQLLLVTSQVRAPGSSKTKLERSAVRAVAPLARTVHSLVSASDWISTRLRTQATLVAENEELRSEIRRQMLENARYQGLEQQVDRLSDALGYKAPFDGRVRLADVIYLDHTSWLRTLLIYEPGRQAVENSPVTAAAGLVGRVILRDGPYAKVQLITDRASGIGAMVERTRRQGIVRGAGSDGLTLEYMPLQADIMLGDRVVTAGTDGLYPRGLPIGVVVEIESDAELFHSVRLTPAIDFSVLDQVFVLLLDSVPGGLKGTSSASPRASTTVVDEQPTRAAMITPSTSIGIVRILDLRSRRNMRVKILTRAGNDLNTRLPKVGPTRTLQKLNE